MYNGDNIIFGIGGDRTPETAPPEESDPAIIKIIDLGFNFYLIY